MYLSPFQKQIVKNISQGDIETVRDFLLFFRLIEPTKVKIDTNTYGDQKPVEGSSDFFFGNHHYNITDRTATYIKLIDFKKVINLLQRAELIEIENSAVLNFGYLSTEKRAVQIIGIINSFRDSLIIPYNEIKNFAKDFQTPQERNQKRQLWVPIVVAISTVLLSSIINYFIYTKEREVYIKNVNAFRDSLYIRILNNVDSTRTKNKIIQDSLTLKNVKVPSDIDLKEKKD